MTAKIQTSAESCQKDVSKYKLNQGLFMISLIITLVGFILMFINLEMIRLLGLGLVMVVASTLLVVNSEPGKTVRWIAQDWKPVRSKLLEYEIIDQVLMVSKEYPDTLSETEEGTKRLLVRSFDQIMKEMSQDLLMASQSGRQWKVNAIEYEMKELEELSRKLGLRMSFEQYFLKAMLA